MQKLAGIPINESKEVEWEFQLRDVGGPVFYKRKSGDDNWMFVSANEFSQGLADGGKLVKWDEN